MSYRLEKESNGQQALVIDGFENGIANSPYEGVANIRNMNVRYYPGVAYTNYKRQAVTLTSGTVGRPQYQTQSPAGIIYIADDNKQIWKQSAANSSTFAILTGNASQLIVGMAYWNNYLIIWEANGTIEICGDGSDDSGVTSSNWNTAGATTGVWPIKSGVTVTLTATAAAGATSATLSSYTDAQGTSRAFWNGPSGFYNVIVAGTSQEVLANLVQGSTAISWNPALNVAASGPTLSVRTGFTNTGSVSKPSIIPANNGNLYFCNGNQVGAFIVPAFQNFDKTKMQTFVFNTSALALPRTETAVWLTELRNQLLVAGVQKVYPWDFNSPEWQNPIPMDEKIVTMINTLNNVYILAGTKGNIYQSNGYSIARFKKIPDYLAGSIDPQWLFGGIMSHRQRLWFQALAKSGQAGTTLFQGIFSLDLDTGALVVENQNSFGTVQSSSEAMGVLIDINDLSIGYDKYYSGAKGNAGVIDYNDTTLYSSNEPMIETDLIPVGTFATPWTPTTMEFKLDRPMATSDSITVYARASLSDTYVQVGTTTSAVLSDLYQSNFQKYQWVQFKVTVSCNSSATTSSFVPIREIRIR